MNNLVFVYGTLKKGHGNSILLNNSKFLGPAKTVGSMYLFSQGIPVVSNNCNGYYNIKPLPISGEVYKITKEQLVWLDDLEGHPNAYKRILELVELQSGEILDVWIYTMEFAFGTCDLDNKYSEVKIINDSYVWSPDYSYDFSC